MAKAMMKYKTVRALMEASQRHEIPVEVCTVKYACEVLGISRQSLHSLIERGSLRSWSAERLILVSKHDVHLRHKKQLGIPLLNRDLFDGTGPLSEPDDES